MTGSAIKGPGIFLAQFAGNDAPFIARHLIEVTGQAFDDFAGGRSDQAVLDAMLGIRS